MLSPKFILNSINPLAIDVCRVLSKAGYQAYLVGGCVRDLLLGIKPKDYDITTNALPEKVIKLFPKTYPTGLQHGTITVAMENEHFEVTTFRVEGEYKDGRRPEEVFFVSNIKEDLARRDLTLNAMAFNPLSQELIDPFNGFHDLEIGLIKAVGNPSLRFQEDGLRIMRVARFAARFGYVIDQTTFEAMHDNLCTLRKVSKERINDELCKTLMSNYDTYGLQILLESKALEIVCPLLIYPNTELYVLPYQNKCLGDLETRLAYLYGYHFINDVKRELITLKFSNKEIKRVLFLLDLAEKYNQFMSEYTVSSYKYFMAHLKNNTPDTWEYTLDQFIKLYTAMGYGIMNYLAKFQGETVFSRREMNINGDDLITIGILPGPEIKRILDQCYQFILEKPECNEHFRLLKFVIYGDQLD